MLEIYFHRALVSQFFGQSPMVSFCRGVRGSGCASEPGGGGSLGFSLGDGRVISPGHGSHAVRTDLNRSPATATLRTKSSSMMAALSVASTKGTRRQTRT